MIRKILTIVAAIGVAILSLKHDGHEQHWWWDNLNHLLGGFILGMILSGNEPRRVVLVSIIWEGLEYVMAETRINEAIGLFPDGPRALGHDEWTFDHQIEDTILDTAMAHEGAELAQKLKQR